MGFPKTFYHDHPALVDSTMDYISAFTGGYNIWAFDSKGEIRWLRLSCDEKRLRAMLQTYLYTIDAEYVLGHMDYGQMIASLFFASGQQMWDMTTKIQRL